MQLCSTVVLLALQRAELVKRSEASKDAVIPFSTSEFDRFAAAAGRDYHLVFFLNAAYLQSNSQMNLPALRTQFALMAKVGVLCSARKHPLGVGLLLWSVRGT